MKYLLFILPIFILLINREAAAQPNVCLNPPNGYTIGGNFDITVLRDNNVVVDDYLCLPEKGTVSQIGIFDKSTLLRSSIRYIFGVDNSTIIPPSMPLSISRTVDGQSAGEFWVMQLGEENSVKKLNCKKIQIDVSDKPKLQLDNSSCAMQKLTLTISSDNPLSYYLVNWNDGKPAEKVIYQNQILKVTHTFSQTNPESIEVIGVYENTTLNRTCNSKAITISTPPFFYIKSLETQNFGNNLNAILGVQDSRGINMDLYVSDDDGLNYTQNATFNSSFYTVRDLPKKNLCFKVKSLLGPCLYESEPVCVINPKADNSQLRKIDLQWNNVGINTTYEIKRTGGTEVTYSNLASTSFSDRMLSCSSSYSYQIKGEYFDTNKNPTKVISYLVESSTNSSANPPPKQVLFATITNNGSPQLNIIDTTETMQYIIYRSIDGAPFSKINETQNNTYIDTGNANLNQYCYYIRYIDGCNNLSANSPTVCTILLKNETKQLNWNKPIESQLVKSINYEIIQLNPIQIVALQPENSYNLTIMPSPLVQYQIKAIVTIEVNGKSYVITTTSNPISINFQTNIYFPTAFSPNDDNINDTFMVKGDFSDITDFKMLIFNQWGESIFESNDFNLSWDGNVDTLKVQSGFYTVIISYKDIFGQLQRKTDKIMLFR